MSGSGRSWTSETAVRRIVPPSNSAATSRRTSRTRGDSALSDAPLTRRALLERMLDRPVRNPFMRRPLLEQRGSIRRTSTHDQERSQRRRCHPRYQPPPSSRCVASNSRIAPSDSHTPLTLAARTRPEKPAFPTTTGPPRDTTRRGGLGQNVRVLDRASASPVCSHRDRAAPSSFDGVADSEVGSVVEEIARRHGRRSVEPQLVRSGANHVYVVDDIVVRVARSDVDVGLHLAVGRWLQENGVPVPEPVGSGELDGNRYSVWEYIQPDNSSIVDFHQFGTAIRALHEVDLGGLADFDLPWCDEPNWLDIERNLVLARAAKVVPDEDVDLLQAQANRLRSWGDRCRAAAVHVVCHGDVHPQNVLMRDGRAVIVDWDTICLGPPQWDHAALLTSGAAGGEADPVTIETSPTATERPSTAIHSQWSWLRLGCSPQPST